MNAILSTTIPLPVTLNQPTDPARLDDLLFRLGRGQAPLDRDQAATAARQYCDDSQLAVEPPCIRERMGRLEAAALQSAQRGSATAGFARADWERTRAEAHALATHQRAVREHSYLPQPAAMFRVH